MTDSNDPNERTPERRAAEGVRIIGAEEAQKALDAGQAAGRRAEDELRYGDVPPAPSGPRPPHRFPLPGSVDPAEAVPRPPIAPIRGESPIVRTQRASVPASPASEPALSAPEPEPEPETPAPPAAQVETPALPVPVPETPAPPAAQVETPALPVPVPETPAPRPWDSRLPRPSEPRPSDAPPVPDEPAAAAPLAPHDPTGRVWALGADQGEPGAAWTPPEPAPPPEAPARLPGAVPPGGLRWAPEARPASSAAPEQPGRPQVPGDRPRRPDLAADVPGRPEVAPDAVRGSGLAADRPGPADVADDPQGRLDVAPDPPAARSEVSGADKRAPASGPTGSAPAAPVETWSPAWSAPAAPPEVRSDPAADPTTALGGWEPSAEWRKRPSWNLGERSPTAFDDAPAAAAEPPPADPAGAEPAWRESAAIDPAGPGAGSPVIEEGITVTGSSDLPHWTDPPAGDLPASLGGVPRDDDDLGVWGGLHRGARWRSEHDGWDEADEDVDYLAGDESPEGALDQDRSEESDLFSFDAAFERLEEERSGSHPVLDLDDSEGYDDDEELVSAPAGRGGMRRRRSPAVRSRGVRRPPVADEAPARPARPSRPGRDGTAGRLGIGLGLAVVLVLAYVIGPKACLVLAAAVVVACAAETYGVLQRTSGFRPATLLGLVATGGLMFAAYWKGLGALPLVMVIAFVATIVWYLLGEVAKPLANVAVTVMVLVWVGLLGSYSAVLLRAHDGRGLFFGVVAVTVIADIAAYFGGRQFGHRPLAPEVSPGKTVEGLVIGTVAAIIVGAIVGHSLAPWGGLKHGLLLGVAVAVIAPIGDLFESLIKRDLGVKDSGTALAGHGGMLDRFDSLLLVLPVAFYLANYLGIVR